MGNQELVDILRGMGVDVRKEDGREITGRCPVHHKTTGHADNSPSWSMNVSSGLWICFSCGARGSLAMLVEELTGSDDAMSVVRDLAFQAAADRANGFTSVSKSQPDVDWITFSRFAKVPDDKASTRNLEEDILNRYGVRWDLSDKCWIIPIVSPTGELMGWQGKKKNWVKNVPDGVQKSVTLFGLNKFKSKTAVLVESPLDVVRFGGVFDSPQALASFGTAVSDEQLKLLSMVADRLMIAMDNDVAGLKAARDIYRRVPPFRKGVMFFNYGNSNAKDIGDMSDRQIMFGVSNATLLPPWVNS